ncbi:unnamed protein product [Laminaria digitata]
MVPFTSLYTCLVLSCLVLNFNTRFLKCCGWGRKVAPQKWGKVYTWYYRSLRKGWCTPAIKIASGSGDVCLARLYVWTRLSCCCRCRCRLDPCATIDGAHFGKKTFSD